MKKMLVLTSILLVAVAILAACGGQATEAPEAPETPAELEAPAATEALPEPAGGSVSNGGKLYTKWWAALGLDEPTEDQPLWATQSTNERTGADTWRCKECHGWDYIGADGLYNTDSSHYTGFPGVFEAQDMSTEEIIAWLDGTNNTDHDFSVIGEEAMIDLATFLQEGLLDMREYIDYETGRAIEADQAHGEELYGSVCSTCHGEDGRALPDLIVGEILNNEPWQELAHLVRTGVPGAPMPASHDSGWSLQDVMDVLTYESTLPTEAP